MISIIYIACLFSPAINGKEYYGILFSIVIGIIYQIFNIRYNMSKMEIILFIYSIIEIIQFFIINLIALSNITIYKLLTICINSFTPYLMFSLGYRLHFEMRDFKNIIIVILLFESAVGILQLISINIRQITYTFYGVSQKYIPEYDYQISRSVGTIGNPNNFSFLVCILIFNITIFIFKNNSKNIFENAFMLLSVLIGIISIIFSFSRTGIIIFFILETFIFIYFKKTKLIIVLYILVFFVFLYLNNKLFFMNTFLRRITSDGLSFGARENIWKEYLIYIKNQDLINILFGSGFDILPSLNKVPDNKYISEIFTKGIIGFILFIVKMIILFKFDNCRYKVIIKNIIIVSVLVLFITSDLDIINNAIIYLLLGCIMNNNIIPYYKLN